MLNEWQHALRYLAIVGLVPYSRHQHHQQWQQIYTLALLLPNWILTFYGIYYLPLESELIVSSFVSVLVFFTQSLTLSVCLLEAAFSYAPHFEYMRQTQHIAALFRQRLHTCLCRWSLRRLQRRKYIWYLAVSYGGVCISIVVITTKYYYGYFWYALGSILVLRLRALQAMVYMDYIGFYMQTLNMKLRALVSCKVSKQRGCLDVDYKLLESFEYLLHAKQLYNELYKLTMNFNDFFGTSLCALFTVFFLDITVNAYWTFLTLADIYEFHFIYLSLATLIPLVIILAFLCYTGEHCKQECHSSAILIQRLLNSACKDANSRVYNDLLMEFALQIMQDPIIISAKGLVTVDLRLLMQMFVAIVTYLVILMQFRSSNEELQKNPI